MIRNDKFAVKKMKIGTSIRRFTNEIQTHLPKIPANCYAIIEVNSKPFLVSQNDLIIIDKTSKLGDLLKFDRIREVGSNDPEFKLQGNPFTNHFNIYGRVVEYVEREHKTLYQKRSGRSQTKFNKTMHSLVRISKIELNKDACD